MVALNDLFQVDERHNSILGPFTEMARQKWWKYAIADEWPGVSPLDVDQWETDEILEALGELARREAKRPKKGGK